MSHNSCNTGTCGLPDMSTLSPQVYISGKLLVPVLQLIRVGEISAQQPEENYLNAVEADSKSWRHPVTIIDNGG